MKLELLNKTIGHRTICGTDWPIDLVLVRLGPREYCVTKLFNGVAEFQHIFNFLRDAKKCYAQLERHVK